jgi:hypothetical protein
MVSIQISPLQIEGNLSLSGATLQAALQKELEKRIAGKTAQMRKDLISATKSMVVALAGNKESVDGVSPEIRVGNKSLGVVKPKVTLAQSSLAKYLLSKSGAAELGIPDPKEALDTLQKSIPQIVQVTATVTKSNIKLRVDFRAGKLISLNPHPGKRFPNGQKIPVSSWLQWTTGPKFQAGISNYGLAKISTIKKVTIGSSRTAGYSGGEAALMLKTTSIGAKRSQYQHLTGQTGSPWKPVTEFRGIFWKRWWDSNLSSIRQIMTKVIKEIVKQAIKGA